VKDSVVAARRDSPGKGNKAFLSRTGLATNVANLLDDAANDAGEGDRISRREHSRSRNFAELAEAVQDGWAFSYWCGRKECEARVKEETKATTRNVPLDQPEGKGTCIVCGEPAEKKVYFARAY
jgi:prolyl-tRNA synthetase